MIGKGAMPKSPKRRDLDRLVKSTLDDMHVPAGLRKIATENLLQRASKHGEGDLEKVAAAAKSRKLRVKSWIASRAPAIQKKRQLVGVLPVEPEVIQPVSSEVQGRFHKEFWGFLLKHARSAPELAGGQGSWVASLQKAVDLMLSLRADRPDLTKQVFKKACVLLENTMQEADFAQAPQQVKGAIFAEAANLWAVCSWIEVDASGMGKSLDYYRHAASIFSREKAPKVLAFVQLNRLQTLAQYGDMISSSHLRAYEYDMLDASEFISNNSSLVVGTSAFVDTTTVLNDVRALEKFVRAFRPKPSLSIMSGGGGRSSETDGNDFFSIVCSSD